MIAEILSSLGNPIAIIPLIIVPIVLIGSAIEQRKERKESDAKSARMKSNEKLDS